MCVFCFVFHKRILRGRIISLLYNTLLDVASLWIFTSESVLYCPVLKRLSRAPPGPSRPRVRTMPAPHCTRFYRRKNGPRRRPRLAGGVEKSRPRSPIWRGIVKTWKSQHDAATQPLHSRTHVLLLYVQLRCCARRVVGWVGLWFGYCTCFFCCSTTAVILLCMVHAGVCVSG